MAFAITAENAPFLQRAFRRAAQLAACDPQVGATVSTMAQRSAVIGNGRRRSIELVQAACAEYATRPFIMSRCDEGPYEPTSYARLWERVVRCASGALQCDLFRAGDFVGIFGFASADYVVTDLACLYGGAVSVPLRTAMPTHELCHVILQAGLRCIFCSQEQLPRLAAVLPSCPGVQSIVVIDGFAAPLTPAAVRTVLLSDLEDVGGSHSISPVLPPGGDTLVSLCYTSGSTALPKGAMLTEQVWQHTFTGAMFTSYPDLPGITFGYTPLSHIAGRNNTYRELHRGGVMYLARKSDMSTLFDDIKLARPLYFMAVPRLTEMVLQRFQAACVRCGVGEEGPGRAEILGELSGLFGERLCLI
ncbi:MAG: hypothetical protein EOO40_09355, partial [Deltaproteobacteria bacterium]